MIEYADVNYDARTQQWTVRSTFRVPVAFGGIEYTLEIPQGFVSDLASIPRAFWWLVATYELSPEAAIVHDWLYRHGGQITVVEWNDTLYVARLTRERADECLYQIAAHYGVWWWRRWLAYKAVRLCAKRAWKGN